MSLSSSSEDEDLPRVYIRSRPPVGSPYYLPSCSSQSGPASSQQSTPEVIVLDDDDEVGPVVGASNTAAGHHASVSASSIHHLTSYSDMPSSRTDTCVSSKGKTKSELAVKRKREEALVRDT